MIWYLKERKNDYFFTCRTVCGNGIGKSSVSKHKPLVIEYGNRVVNRRISRRTDVQGQFWTLTNIYKSREKQNF
jgi:hypothetical protein